MLATVDGQRFWLFLTPKLNRPAILGHPLPWLLVKFIWLDSVEGQRFWLFRLPKLYRPAILGLLFESIRLPLPTIVTDEILDELLVSRLLSKKRHLDHWIIKLRRLWPTRSGWSL